MATDLIIMWGRQYINMHEDIPRDEMKHLNYLSHPPPTTALPSAQVNGRHSVTYITCPAATLTTTALTVSVLNDFKIIGHSIVKSFRTNAGIHSGVEWPW